MNIPGIQSKSSHGSSRRILHGLLFVALWHCGPSSPGSTDSAGAFVADVITVPATAPRAWLGAATTAGDLAFTASQPRGVVAWAAGSPPTRVFSEAMQGTPWFLQGTRTHAALVDAVEQAFSFKVFRVEGSNVTALEPVSMEGRVLAMELSASSCALLVSKPEGQVLVRLGWNTGDVVETHRVPLADCASPSLQPGVLLCAEPSSTRVSFLDHLDQSPVVVPNPGTSSARFIPPGTLWMERPVDPGDPGGMLRVTLTPVEPSGVGMPIELDVPSVTTRRAVDGTWSATSISFAELVDVRVPGAPVRLAGVPWSTVLAVVGNHVLLERAELLGFLPLVPGAEATWWQDRPAGARVQRLTPDAVLLRYAWHDLLVHPGETSPVLAMLHAGPLEASAALVGEAVVWARGAEVLSTRDGAMDVLLPSAGEVTSLVALSTGAAWIARGAEGLALLHDNGTGPMPITLPAGETPLRILPMGTDALVLVQAEQGELVRVLRANADGTWTATGETFTSSHALATANLLPWDMGVIATGMAYVPCNCGACAECLCDSPPAVLVLGSGRADVHLLYAGYDSKWLARGRHLWSLDSGGALFSWDLEDAANAQGTAALQGVVGMSTDGHVILLDGRVMALPRDAAAPVEERWSLPMPLEQGRDTVQLVDGNTVFVRSVSALARVQRLPDGTVRSQVTWNDVPAGSTVVALSADVVRETNAEGARYFYAGGDGSLRQVWSAPHAMLLDAVVGDALWVASSMGVERVDLAAMP